MLHMSQNVVMRSLVRNERKKRTVKINNYQGQWNFIVVSLCSDQTVEAEILIFIFTSPNVQPKFITCQCHVSKQLY